MVRNLRELKTLIVITMMCAVGLTVGATEIADADSLDFTGTTVTVDGLADIEGSSGVLYSPNGEYIYVGLNLGKPAYELTIGDVVIQLKWVSSDEGNNTLGDASCWVFIVKGAQLSGFAICPEFTDSVPLNGWINTKMGDEEDDKLVLTMTGCFENNIIVDPLTGVKITLTGTGAYDGELTYCGMDDAYELYPIFTDTISSDSILTLNYYYGWKLQLNGVDLFTNNYFLNGESSVPENNWVDVNAVEGTRGNIMYISELYGITIDIYEDNDVVVVGAKYDGTYTYAGMINDYPSYSIYEDSKTYVIMRNDTAWVLKYGSESTDFSTSGILTNYSTKIEGSFVPQNGWTEYRESIPMMSGSATKFVYAGEIITATGSENGDVDGIYTFVEVSTNTGKPIFSMMPTSGPFMGSELTLEYQTWPNYAWLIKTIVNDVDTIIYSNTNLAYNSVMECVPQDAWTPTVTLSGIATAAYDDAEITISGNVDLEGSFIYTGMINDKVSFVNGYFTISYSDDVWSITRFGVPYYTNANVSGILVPENTWVRAETVDDDIVISGDSTFFVEEISAITDNYITNIMVSPNPASVSVAIESVGVGTLEVYSLTGVRVMSNTLCEGMNNLSISTLTSGVYLFVSNVEGNKTVVRVIKN